MKTTKLKSNKSIININKNKTNKNKISNRLINKISLTFSKAINNNNLRLNRLLRIIIGESKNLFLKEKRIMSHKK